MNVSIKRYVVPALCAGLVSAMALSGPAKAADALSSAELLYADLAKLSPEDRAKKILEGAQKEGQLNAIVALRGKLGQGFNKIFMEKYPFIKFAASDMGAQDSVGRMVSEEAAGRHLTDVAGTTVPDMALAMEKNVQARYPTPASDLILPRYNGFKDPTGNNRWLPFMWSEHGITYNPNLLKGDDEPKTWEDMCRPIYKGTMSFEPAETRFLVGLYSLMGEEKLKKWIECVGKNDPIIQRGHTTRLTLMMAGDHAVSPDQYLYNGTGRNMKNPKKAPFAVAYTAPILAYAAVHLINKNTPNPYTSALFADWALTVPPQEHLAKALRAPIAIKHPFIPDDATVFPFSYVDSDVIDRLHGYWNQYIGKS